MWVGCHDDAVDTNEDDKPSAYCESTGALSRDDSFSHGGETDGIYQILYGGGIFGVAFENGLLGRHVNELAVVVAKVGDSGSRRQLHLVDGGSSPQGGDRGEYRFFSWPDVSIQGWTVGAQFQIQLVRAAPPPLPVVPDDGAMTVFWDTLGSGVLGHDVHYTASTTVDDYAAASGSDPSAGWVAVSRTDTIDTNSADVQPTRPYDRHLQLIRDLTNGTRYRVRVRGKYSNGVSPWKFGAGTPTAAVQPPPVVFTPDPDLLTGLTIHDGVRDLPPEPNFANAVGFGGPGTYAVQAPPGLDRVTVTPTWTNTSITSVSGSVRHVTYGRTGSSVTWSSSESGVGKTVSLNGGTTRLTLSVAGVASGPYRLFIQHNLEWKSSNDRLLQLELQIPE